jgi:hypothetical protein
MIKTFNIIYINVTEAIKAKAPVFAWIPLGQHKPKLGRELILPRCLERYVFFFLK